MGEFSLAPLYPGYIVTGAFAYSWKKSGSTYPSNGPLGRISFDSSRVVPVGIDVAGTNISALSWRRVD